jgi:KUP system potassium uptake protein
MQASFMKNDVLSITQPDAGPGLPGQSGHATALSGLVLGALGVVYGDIGTSPLYTLKTALDWAGGATPAVALGMFSLIVWTLVMTTSIKYVALVMRADNDGEGGILALMARLALKGNVRTGLVAVGMLGAALLYGDGAITPAISVLSALEGLKDPVPGISPYILPLTVAILFGLFALQRQGTAKIGRLFGPVMVVWFLSIGLLGLGGIAGHPDVLRALNPAYGLDYLLHHGFKGFTVLGAVFLSATGAEALYADMGHFGARPIRFGWYALVLPTLLLNYAGQTALVAAGAVPNAGNPFFLLGPDWARLPLVGLATVATIIASQSIISGVFSMTRQAIQLGLLPRLNVVQTSAEGYGQIYVPAVNWALMALTLVLTVSFGSSDRLAAAFGTAVSLTMLLTTVLLYKVMREQWAWPAWLVVSISAALAVVDTAFVGANLTKIVEGGWVPLVAACVVFTLMRAWRSGHAAMARQVERETAPLSLFIDSAGEERKVVGTAVYLSRRVDAVPVAMLHSAKHFHVLHERIVIMSIDVKNVPRIGAPERVEWRSLGNGFYHVILRYGFMQQPDVPAALADIALDGEPFDMMQTSFFLSQLTITEADGDGVRLGSFVRRLYAWMHRNELDAIAFLRLPANRIVELGARVGL